MSHVRINPIDPADATGKAKELLNAVQSKLGRVPNMMRAMANSPAALDAYLGFSGALSRGRLGAKTGEQLALTIGSANECEYCVAAHTAIGGMVGLKESDLAAARNAESSDPRTGAALKFADTLIRTRGDVSDADIQRPRCGLR